MTIKTHIKLYTCLICILPVSAHAAINLVWSESGSDVTATLTGSIPDFLTPTSTNFNFNSVGGGNRFQNIRLWEETNDVWFQYGGGIDLKPFSQALPSEDSQEFASDGSISVSSSDSITDFYLSVDTDQSTLISLATSSDTDRDLDAVWTFQNQTLESLGLTGGQDIYNLETTGGQEIGQIVVPEPAHYGALFAIVALGTALCARNHRRNT